MDIRSYILQLTYSPIDSIKFKWLKDHEADTQEFTDTFTYYLEQRERMLDENGEQETLLLSRLEKAQSYQLGTLIRLELAHLSQYYINHSQWEKAIHVAVEEEGLANAAIEKMECLRRLLIGYMAKRDYLRAALVAERLEQIFPIGRLSDQSDDFCLFNGSLDMCQIEEVVLLLLILAMVRGEITDYVTALHRERPLLTLCANAMDRTAYNFIFAILFDNVPRERACFGNIFSVLKDHSGFSQYIERDPWLSAVDGLQQSLLTKLRTTLRGRLLNIEQCSNEQVRQELQTLLL